MEPDKNTPGGKKRPSKNTNAIFSVALSAAAKKKVKQGANDAGTSERDYASAAIDFFARNGLDPTNPKLKTLESVEVDLRKEMAAGFLELADKTTQNTNKVGNRLVTILRAWERDSYEFMLQQQKQTHNYIEQVEANLLKSFVAMETNLLTPIHEQITRVGGQAFVIRFIVETLLTKATTVDPVAQRKGFDDDQSRYVIQQLREYLRLHPVVQPTLTLKPTNMKAPPIAAPKPKVPAVAPATPTQTPT